MANSPEEYAAALREEARAVAARELVARSRGGLPMSHGSRLDALRHADEAASVAHDFVWATREVSQEEASVAIRVIHNTLRPLIEHGREATVPPAGRLNEAVQRVKDAYRELQWVGPPVGDDPTCIGCGERFSAGCEPGCYAGDGWNALIEVCNGAFGVR